MEASTFAAGENWRPVPDKHPYVPQAALRDIEDFTPDGGSGAPPKSPAFWIDCAQNEPSVRACRPRTVTVWVGGQRSVPIRHRPRVVGADRPHHESSTGSAPRPGPRRVGHACPGQAEPAEKGVPEPALLAA